MRNLLINTPTGILSAINLVIAFLLFFVIANLDEHSIVMFYVKIGLNAIIFFCLSLSILLDATRYVFPHHLSIEKLVAIMIFGIFLAGVYVFINNGINWNKPIDIYNIVYNSIGTFAAGFFYYYYLGHKMRIVLKDETYKKKE